MSKHVKRRITAATVVITAAGLVLSSAAANATVGDPDQAVFNLDTTLAAAGQTSVPLALVTGDRLRVGVGADGKPAVHGVVQAPRPDGHPVAFHTFVRDQDVYAVPADALPLLERDVLDWELFNVRKLAELAAANGTVDEVSVIVTRNGEATASRAAAPAGAQLEKDLPSIDGASMTIDGDGSWWRAVQQASPEEAGTARAAEAGPLAGVDKVWLNELAEIALDASVPQVGAPAAWQAGYDGTGVTVAVLDTGIDATHPDLAGRIVEQVDFTGSPNGPVDGHGHGTHVAATIAGTGAASDGQRPGVAPGASLAIGRVCGDAGTCPTDAIIGGMQWAASSGYPIVSMSLGGGPTDGTDPLSAAVNNLSRRHGTLFVIAAGNDGPGAQTVSAPGVADEALSVAAVDKQDQMADFSSRGPRVGDGALKPDIAAPGVNIVAARAAGTAMGTPVDDLYTTANGTSMATPHVSGGAAIVAQQHPDLDGRQLKALLMGTAFDLGHDLFAQGVGRLDVAKAVNPDVFANSLHFGRREFPHQPLTDTITYTNVTDEPIALTLSASLSAHDGTPAPAGMLSLDADEVTVPANGAVDVTVTLDGSVLGEDGVYGRYSGIVVASDSTGAQRAASRLGVLLEPQRYGLTIELIGPEGASELEANAWTVLPLDDEQQLYDGPELLPGGEAVEARLFPGLYSVSTTVTWLDADGERHTALPVAPEVELGRSHATVRLDLREAEPVRVDAPVSAETYHARFGLERSSANGELTATAELAATYAGDEPNWWALPTREVETGGFGFSSQHVLVPPQLSMVVLDGGLAIHPRYPTADVAVSAGNQRWQDGDVLHQRAVRVPVPRLTGLDLTRLVYGGDGSAGALAGVDVDGRLVLITPTDICTTSCNFAQVRERVAAAAAAGAVGVLVAGAEGRVAIGGPSADRTYDCLDGWDSCPPVEEYSPIPIASLPAGEATELIDLLDRRSSLLVLSHGAAEVSKAYSLAYLSGQRVPGSLPHRVRPTDLYRVDHRLHADRPGLVSNFIWQPHVAADPGIAGSGPLNLPNVSTQEVLPVYAGPRSDEVIHRFQMVSAEYAGPFVVDPADVLTEEQEVVLDGRTGWGAVTWGSRPSVPGALVMPVTDSGFAIGGALCAGCRDGDQFYPTFYRTSAGGPRSTLIGMVNDTGLAELFLGSEVCEPPACVVRLHDQGGAEIEQRHIRIELRIGGAADGGAEFSVEGGE